MTRLFTILKNLKILSAAFLAFSFILLPTSEVKVARAQVGAVSIVSDTSLPALETAFNTSALNISSRALVTKEYILDKLGWDLANLAIQQVSAATIRWINSGFNGGPAYITNPEAFFTDLADNALGTFIEGSGLGFLCSPFRAQVRLGLILNQNYRYKAACTLTKVVKNIEDFTSGAQGSFLRNGGWNGWFVMVTQSQNNPYGAYLLAQEQLDLRIIGQQESYKQRLLWGRGFLDFERCQDYPVGEVVYNEDGGETYRETKQKICNTTTPGAVVQEQLNTAIGLPTERLKVADEINEVLSALFSQLIFQVINGGVSGLSENSSQFGGQSFESALFQDIGNQGGNARGTIAIQIDKDLEAENRYLSMKTQGAGRASQSEKLLQDLIACEKTKIKPWTTTEERAKIEERMRSATSTIESRVRPIATSAERDAASAKSNITRLNGYKDQTGIVGLTSLNDLVNDYLSFRGSLHNDQSILYAERELQGTLSALDSLDNDTRNRLEACKVPTP